MGNTNDVRGVESDPSTTSSRADLGIDVDSGELHGQAREDRALDIVASSGILRVLVRKRAR